jgi:hypothetical protein
LIQDYGFRLYNPAIGKFLSVDPLAPEYPWYTPYQFAGNMPIVAVDLDGLEPKISNTSSSMPGSRYEPAIDNINSNVPTIIDYNDYNGFINNMFNYNIGDNPDNVVVLIAHMAFSNSGVRHAALIIGDDVDGWIYISKDGGKKLVSGSSHDVEERYDSFQEFVDSESGQTYASGYQFSETTRNQNVYLEAKKASLKDYGTSGECNCTSVPKRALSVLEINFTDNFAPGTLEEDLQNNENFETIDLN